MRGVSITLRVCAYLSTSDSTAKEIVAQSVVYFTVDIHSLGTMNVVRAKASLVPHLYIGLRVSPGFSNERDICGVPTLLRIELCNVASKRA